MGGNAACWMDHLEVQREAPAIFPDFEAHVHRLVCTSGQQKYCLEINYESYSSMIPYIGVHYLIWQHRSGIAWPSYRWCNTCMHIWLETMVKGICQDTSISDNWCIPEWSNDSCAKVGKKTNSMNSRHHDPSDPSGNS